MTPAQEETCLVVGAMQAAARHPRQTVQWMPADDHGPMRYEIITTGGDFVAIFEVQQDGSLRLRASGDADARAFLGLSIAADEQGPRGEALLDALEAVIDDHSLDDYECLAALADDRSPTMFRLVDIVPVLAATAARALGCSNEDVLGQSRARTPTLARHCAMVAARRWTRPGESTSAFSLTDVGHAFGGRSHTTVLYAQRETARRERIDPAVAELLGALADVLEAAAGGVAAVAEDRLGADLRAAHARVAELESARGDVAREVRLARIAGVAEGAAQAKARHPRQTRSRRPPPRLLSELVGRYRTATGDRRRLVFVQTDTEWLLLDRGEDERVVERFERSAGLLEVCAIATAYLEQVRSVGAPCATEILS
jgi:hypothetical protein